MKHIPNIITSLRFLGGACLLLCNPDNSNYPDSVLVVDMGGGIIVIKLVNQVFALIVCKRFCFPHTTANKLTGLLLFLSVPTVFWSFIPIAIVAGVATFAAIHEGCLRI